jgi:hypothetical protein
VVIVGGLALVLCGPFVRGPTGGASVCAAELAAFDFALVRAVVGVAPAEAVVVEPPSVPDPSAGASAGAVFAGVGAVETLVGVPVDVAMATVPAARRQAVPAAIHTCFDESSSCERPAAVTCRCH